MFENEEKDFIPLLKEIFHFSKKDPLNIYPIVKNSDKIVDLKTYMESKDNNNKKKLFILDKLKNFFLLNKGLIPFFIEKYKSISSNFYYPIIDLYLSEDMTEENLKFLEEFLNLLNSHISISKLSLEYIYQKLGVYYRNEGGKNKLTEPLLIRYLHLLQIFYKDTTIIENNQEEILSSQDEKELQNYIYLNGYGSEISLSLNLNSLNYNASFPTLENGCSFFFWINLSDKLLEIYRKIYPKIEISLITINIGANKFKLILKETKYLQIIINESESNSIDLSSAFQFNKWNNICLVIGKSDKNSIKLYINYACNHFNISIPKNFPINEKIDSIKCFQNLIGRVSSLLFFSFPLEHKVINYFSLQLKHGFYKNKILYKFLHSNNNEYLNNALNYKYTEKFKNEKSLNNEFKILYKEYNIKNIISFFCPFAYNHNKNEIDDIFGNYIGILSKEDGVNYYINYTKNIKQVGGMNILLPIAELMFSSNTTNPNISYPLIDNNILSEKTLFEYLIIIKQLLINHSKNLYDANKSKFFSSLGLFLEKFPSKIFTEKILHILVDLGKEIFQAEFDYNSSKNDNYINMILLNEKIFSKFSEENQRKLWENVYQFFTSDYSQMKDSLNISKICLLLRFYDEKRYNEYCCNAHAQMFSKQKNNSNLLEKEDKIPIMNPEMSDKVDKLFDTIQIYINKLPIDDNETINLYKLLALDISPCLQKKIIQVYINHFLSANIPLQKKKDTLKNLLENDYIEITEYSLSISLLDVRIHILSLFKIIISEYYDDLSKYFSKGNNERNPNIRFDNIFNFISENLLLDKLLVEIDCVKSKDDKDKDSVENYDIDKNYDDFFDFKKRSNTERNINLKNINFKVLSKESMILTDSKKLVKYFNKSIYESQINSLYKFFIEWLANSLVREKKILSFVIDFLIKLVCKISPDYIDNFANSLFSYFNRNDIINKNSLYENKNIYPWLIETIYFFNISENIKNFEENIILKIHERTLDLFCEILSSKRPKIEFKIKIKYILDYSYYLKYLYQNDNKKKEEVARITRILLERIIGCSPGNINIKSVVCFEFMVFYKNSEKLFKIDYDLFNKENRSISCFFTNISKSDIIFNQENNNKISNDNNNNININNINEDNNIDNSNNFIDNKQFQMSKTLTTTDTLFLKNKEYIPKYIMDGLNYNEQTEDSNNNSQIKTLSELWKDFSIYDNIIDYYHSNLWGIERICRKVNIEYNGRWAEVCDSLLEKYGNQNKKYKNILMEEIFTLLNLSTDKEEENLEELEIFNKEKESKIKTMHSNYKKDLTKTNEDLINIFNINIILLSIAIEITKDKEQKEYIEKQYQQFLIFCILASININSSVKSHDLIQDILYKILGYGCLFLKKKDESKYKEIETYLIEPIIKEINEDSNKSGFRLMLGRPKKSFYRYTAVFKLFALDEKEKDFKQENDNIKSEDGKKRTTRLATVDKVTPIKRKNNLMNLDDNKGEFLDDLTVTKQKSEHKNRVLLEFHGNDNELINNLFDKTLEKYKEYRENNDNIEILKNYYEINKRENELDISVKKEKDQVKGKIKELIPVIETQIKQYSNTSFLQEKKRRNNYKKMKKRLFSWRGFWSDRYLFFKHPEFLKVKLKNHFTNEMTKPLFSPVLDINYYLPNFTKFEKKNLFNKNNYNYNINLDIDEILGDENYNLNINNEIFKKNKEEKDNTNTNNKNAKRVSISTYYNKKKTMHGARNNYGFNYLESLYKLNYEGIWELYNNYSEQRILPEKKELNKNDINEIFQSQVSTISTISNINIDSKNKNQIYLSTLETKLITKQNITLGCCIVKPTHHIKGNITAKKNYFHFLYEDNSNKTLETLQDELENDPNFDKDMGCCYGSIFKNHKKDKDNISFILEYSNIKYMFIRVYFYKESGLEIYTKTNKSYYLNFKTKEDMHLFLNEILTYINYREIKTENKRVLGYEQLFIIPTKKKSYYVTNKMEEWQNYIVSTLEYLMWLNIYSGRSFNDLTQYPIIPWIISNYEVEQLHYKGDHRDLSLPMGMIELECYDKSATRKETYIETYESLKNEFKEANPDFNFESYLQKGDEYFDSYKAKKIKNKKKNIDNNDLEEELDSIQINQIPYFFGSHYSNPTYVSHYLTRIFPYSFVSIEIQGDKFDDPDRMFISMEKTFESACTLKDDVRELIPEFYTLPGMFSNKNNLNLSQGKVDSEGKEVNINNVILPKWSENNATNFVSEMRKFLENHNDKINKWIDLIFGSYQRGEKAEEAHNIFMAQTYEKMIKIEEVTDPDYRGTLMRLIEIGVTPYKILFNDSKPRIDKNTFYQKNSAYSYSRGNILCECKTLDYINLESKNYRNLILNSLKKDKKKNKEMQEIKIFPKILKIKYIDDETLRIFLSTNQCYDIKYFINNKEVSCNDLEFRNFANNSSVYAASYQINSLSNQPFIVYGKSKYIIKGGFWDGRLEFNYLPTEPKEQPKSTSIFSQYEKPIVAMEMSEDEKYLMCGTTSGLLSIFSIDGENINNIDNLFLHSDEITSISINNNLNMFATVSKDGYLFLYILPSFSLVRAIKLSTKIKDNKNENKKEVEIQIEKNKEEEKDKKEEVKVIEENKNKEEEKDKKEEEKVIEENKNKDEQKDKKEEVKAIEEQKNKEDEKAKEEIKEEKKEELKEEKKEIKEDESKEEKKEEINEPIKEKEDKKEEIKGQILNEENKENNKDINEEQKEQKEQKEEIKDENNIKEENIENKDDKEKEKEKENDKEKEKENEKEKEKEIINEENKEKTEDINKADNNKSEIIIENKNDNNIKKDENNNNNDLNNDKNINVINNEINTEQKSNNNILEKDDEIEEEENIYADNVFLSSSPLPCVTVYISKKRLFRTYTINGEFVGEEKEEDDHGSQFIKSPIIFKNLNFQDFLIYGTDKGYIKIRAFPKMNIIGNIINVCPGNSIETLEISKDKRYCYAWSKGNEIINIIKDTTVSSIQASENITRMGFNIGIR